MLAYTKVFFSLVLCEVNSNTENIVSDRQGKNFLDLEIVDWSHDPTRCPRDKPFVWCLQADYNREKHPYSCNCTIHSRQNIFILFLQFCSQRTSPFLLNTISISLSTRSATSMINRRYLLFIRV